MNRPPPSSTLFPTPPLSRPLLARVFKPRGDEPFPALVECHGGAWCLSDRTTERLRHEAMASHGIVSIALRSEEHTSELQSQSNLVCRLLLEKKKKHR